MVTLRVLHCSEWMNECLFERQRDRDIFSISWFTSEMPPTIRTAPGQSQDLWTQFRFPTWVSQLSSVSLPGNISRKLELNIEPRLTPTFFNWGYGSPTHHLPCWVSCPNSLLFELNHLSQSNSINLTTSPNLLISLPRLVLQSPFSSLLAQINDINSISPLSRFDLYGEMPNLDKVTVLSAHTGS